MRILTAAESRTVDRWAIEKLALPAALLMEHAAVGLRDRVLEVAPGILRPLIVCGPGNNGGDGLALGRLLAARGLRPVLALVRWGREPSPETACQLGWLRGLGLEVREPSLPELLELCREAELVVDALFGTGLNRPLAGEPARWVESLAGVSRRVLAVDLPSGLEADGREVTGPIWKAQWTVTFGSLKPAHVFEPGERFCGEVTVVDLGFPIDAAPLSAPPAWWVEPDSLRGTIAQRDRAAHKGKFGHLVLVAGSVPMPGAALLAGRAAVRSGTGLVTGIVPARIHDSLPGACPEVMWFPAGLEAGARRFSTEQVLEIESLLSRATAVAIGPGLGRASETLEAVADLAARIEVPLLLDADGLAPFEGCLERLAKRDWPTVLTPHPGEMSRLLGIPTEVIQRDRLGSARSAAERSGAVVVLKGHRTVVASPSGEAWINSSGTPALAVGGSGDVLTGLLGGLLAQRVEPIRAAVVAVSVHGRAGERAVAREGGVVVPATSLVEELGPVLREIVL